MDHCLGNADPPRIPLSPPSWHAHGAYVRHRIIPHQGSFRLITWNAQGLLAKDPSLQPLKMKHLLHLCNNHDIIYIQETHSTEDSAAAWQHPREFTPFFSHGDAISKGVLILIRNTYLQQFNPVTHESIHEIEKGRILQIDLHHPDKGNLRLLNVYLHAGHQEKMTGRPCTLKSVNGPPTTNVTTQLWQATSTSLPAPTTDSM